jgi:hypothetical protein
MSTFYLNFAKKKAFHEPFDPLLEYSGKNSEILGNTRDGSVEDLLCRYLCASRYLSSFSESQWHINLIRDEG